MILITSLFASIGIFENAPYIFLACKSFFWPDEVDILIFFLPLSEFFCSENVKESTVPSSVRFERVQSIKYGTLITPICQ